VPAAIVSDTVVEAVPDIDGAARSLDVVVALSIVRAPDVVVVTAAVVLAFDTVNAVLVAVVSTLPATAARNVYAPAISILRLLNATTPSPLSEPISSAVVPSNVPAPLAIDIARGSEAASPTVESLPKSS
jgi:hypothetical protein